MGNIWDKVERLLLKHLEKAAEAGNITDVNNWNRELLNFKQLRSLPSNN